MVVTWCKPRSSIIRCSKYTIDCSVSFQITSFSMISWITLYSRVNVSNPVVIPLASIDALALSAEPICCEVTVPFRTILCSCAIRLNSSCSQCNPIITAYTCTVESDQNGVFRSIKATIIWLSRTSTNIYTASKSSDYDQHIQVSNQIPLSFYLGGRALHKCTQTISADRINISTSRPNKWFKNVW